MLNLKILVKQIPGFLKGAYKQLHSLKKQQTGGQSVSFFFLNEFYIFNKVIRVICLKCHFYNGIIIFFKDIMKN